MGITTILDAKRAIARGTVDKNCYDRSMAQVDKCAAILRQIVRTPGKTKLYLKQATGYSMETVLAAVDELAALGWVQVEEVPQPSGKAHAKISPGDRPIYGLAPCDEGWECCRLSPSALTTPQIERYAAKPSLAAPCLLYADNPLYRAYLAGIWTDRERFVYLDSPDYVIVMPCEQILSVANLPSPYWQGRRLTYEEAWADASLRPDLARDLTDQARAWLGLPVYTALDLPPLPPAAVAAYACTWQVLHAPTKKDAHD